jgi:hypothetical protein
MNLDSLILSSLLADVLLVFVTSSIDDKSRKNQEIALRAPEHHACTSGVQQVTTYDTQDSASQFEK